MKESTLTSGILREITENYEIERIAKKEKQDLVRIVEEEKRDFECREKNEKDILKIRDTIKNKFDNMKEREFIESAKAGSSKIFLMKYDNIKCTLNIHEAVDRLNNLPDKTIKLKTYEPQSSNDLHNNELRTDYDIYKFPYEDDYDCSIYAVWDSKQD